MLQRRPRAGRLARKALEEPTGSLVAEEENQVDTTALDATLIDAVRRAAGLRSCRQLQSQEARELVVEHEFRRAPLAELLPQPQKSPVADLLTGGDPGAQLTGLSRGGDLEEVEVEGAAD